MQIKGDVVQRLRKHRGWSQEELAKMAKLEKGTVSRMERSDYYGCRAKTADNLGDALGVPVTVLTGEERLDPKSEQRLLVGQMRSAVTFELDNAACNALALTAERYRVRGDQILELAPFLFSWVSEMSLRRRDETLVELQECLAAVDKLRGRMAHLLPSPDFPPLTGDLDVLVEHEKHSIAQRDLFAKELGAGDGDFDQSESGPIVSFLRELAADVPELLEFKEWAPDFAPSFRVGREEANALFGGDKEVVDAVLGGHVVLAKLPTKLDLEQRQDWVRREEADFFQRFDEEERAFEEEERSIGIRVLHVPITTPTGGFE